MFDVGIDDNPGEDEAERDGKRFVKRPLERMPPFRFARLALHAGHALRQLAPPPPQHVLARARPAAHTNTHTSLNIYTHKQ